MLGVLEVLRGAGDAVLEVLRVLTVPVLRCWTLTHKLKLPNPKCTGFPARLLAFWELGVRNYR